MVSSSMTRSLRLKISFVLLRDVAGVFVFTTFCTANRHSIVNGSLQCDFYHPNVARSLPKVSVHSVWAYDIVTHRLKQVLFLTSSNLCTENNVLLFIKMTCF